jgi:hypothetical protein
MDPLAGPLSRVDSCCAHRSSSDPTQTNRKFIEEPRFQAWPKPRLLQAASSCWLAVGEGGFLTGMGCNSCSGGSTRSRWKSSDGDARTHAIRALEWRSRLAHSGARHYQTGSIVRGGVSAMGGRSNLIRHRVSLPVTFVSARRSEIFFDPGDAAAVAVRHVFLLAQSMWLARIDHKFRRNAIAL